MYAPGKIGNQKDALGPGPRISDQQEDKSGE